jgi:Acetyltransferase (GNAT) domain
MHLMEDSVEQPGWNSTKWVKGELLDELTASAVDPRAMLTREAMPLPFNRLDWFTRVAAGDSAGSIPLVAHSWIEGQHCWLFLRDLGGGFGNALSNWYSLAIRPVFGGDPDEASQSTLVKALAKRMGKSRNVPAQLTIGPVPRADGSSDVIKSSFSKSGWFAFRHQSSTSWTANVAGLTFDDYWAARPSQLRNTVQRKAKKSEITTEILTRFDANAWAAYEDVYANSWKPEEGDPVFLRKMAQSESAAGALRMGVARLDGVVIAAQFWTVDAGVAYIHKLAHREDNRDLSPGSILSVALFRHVIDVDNVRSIDFGTGNDNYKADWMDRSDPLDTIRLFKKSSLSGLIGAARAWISALVRRTPLD